MKYKQITDKLRSSAGKESDKESQGSSEFPYFALLNRVLRRRAGVTPVNLLDSSSAKANLRDSGGPSSSRPETSISRPGTPSAIL